MIARRLLEAARRVKVHRSAAARAIVSSLAVPSQRRQIVIIGAGLAGLVAGVLLMTAGQQVRLLEARSRPGGRVLTVRRGFAEGLHADAGAGRIADIHHHTMHWVRHFALPLEPMYPRAGRLIGERGGRGIAGAETGRLSAHHIHHLLMRELSWDAQFTAERSLRTLVTSTLVKPGWYRIAGGMDHLPRAFAAALGQRIEYGAVVTALARDAGGVDVTYRQAGAEQTVRADFAVCAVPYTTLGAIDLSPPLPAEKARVVRDCPYQSAVRVFLQLRDRTWLAPGWSGYGVTEDGLEIWQPTFTVNSRRSMLVLYGQGAAAKPLVDLGQEQRVAAAVERLDALFPGLRDRCEGATQICWDEEPWSLGAQSLHDGLPGARPDVMARPEGRLHFAGEQTSDGWMDGALQSGHRAAREILEALEG